MKPRAKKSFRALRIALYSVVLVAGFYLMTRFELTSLPAGSCSPLRAIAPGDRLWVDLWPREPVLGDWVLFRDSVGEQLLLGRIVEAPEAVTPEAAELLRGGALWIEGDNPECAVRDSRLLGPIVRERLAGRVLLNY